MPVEPSMEAFAAARGEALVRFAFVLCGDSESAKDLAQSAFAKVMRRWPAIVHGGNPEAYMRRVIVTEHVSSHRRPWRRERATEQLPESRAHPDATGLVDDRDAAWRLLASLPRRQRAVLVLRYLEDWSDAQIGAALACSEVTVRSQASRALATLRGQLNRPGQPWLEHTGRAADG